MKAIANTLLTLWRGTTTDEFGEEKDLDEPYAVRVPAQITEYSRSTVRPDSGEKRTTRGYRIQVGGNVPVQDGDRVADRQGRTFIVDEIHRPEALTYLPDLTLEARRTT